MVGIGAPCEVEPKLPAKMSEVKAGESLAQLRVDRYSSRSQQVSAFRFRMPRLVRFLFASVAVALTVACGEPRRLPAMDEVFGDTLTVYALSGTDISYPTALNVGQLLVVRASGVFDFQVAFDINAAGEAVIYPVALLAAEEANVRRVGLLPIDTTFEQVTSAPRTGYVYDQPVTLGPGGVVVIEAQIPCPYPYPQLIFSKLVVDSVKVADRAIYIRAVTDPSCGFRSFLPGLPKS